MKALLALTAVLISYTNLKAATVLTGTFQPILGGTHDGVSITWRLDGNYFRVINQGTDAVVTQVNFESPVLAYLSSDDTEPDFQSRTKNLPQGNSIGFTSNFGFTAKPSPITNGIDVGEYEQFWFAGEPRPFRVGIHVQSIGQADLSDTYLSVVSTVPEPSSTMLLGVAGLGLIMRKRK